MTGVVDVSYRGGRADIRLQRPDVLNAMDHEVFDSLAAAADEVRERADDLGVVVVSGEGRAFSAGIDVSALGGIAGDPAPAIRRVQDGFRKIAALPLPTIASVHGYAFGAGLQLALACDLRVMAADAEVGLLEARFGLVPDLIGSTRLPHLIGPARAKKMIWLAERITGTEAGAIGLAEIVVPAADLETTVDDLAERLEAAPRTVVTQAKQLIDAGFPAVSDGMDAEIQAQIACMSSPAFGETLMQGLRAAGRGEQASSADLS